MNTPYHIKLISTISQSINALVFNGLQDESLSARCWREQRDIYKIIDWVFRPFEKNHCYNAHMSDLKRAIWLLQNRRDV